MDTVGGLAAFLALGAIGVAVLTGPIGAALATWIESKSGKLPAPKIDTGEFDAQAQQLDQLSHRVGELEERLEFTERLLAQHREAERLGRGDA
jgi:hypothetical protein